MALPDRILEPQFHNPFPQIYRVAVLPFFNQSAEPAVDGEAIAMAYYNELQLIPGFEVMPVGVARQMLAASINATGKEPRSGAEFQRLARQMGVDAVLVGSVTEYSPYYPPRMGLSVDWFAANPSFHPIPAGYGLPWGTCEEKEIPPQIVFDADLALARADYEKARGAAAYGGWPDDGAGALPVGPVLPPGAVASVRPPGAKAADMTLSVCSLSVARVTGPPGGVRSQMRTE